MLEKFETRLKNIGKSDKTITAYAKDIKKLLRLKITDEELSFFNMDKFLELPLSTASKQRITSSLRAYSKFLSKVYPLNNIDLPKVPTKNPKYLPKSKIIELINSETDPEIKALLLLLFSTGCRIESVVNIKIEDIHDTYIEIKIAKNNKPYEVNLQKSVKDQLTKIIGRRTSGYLFHKKNGKKCSTSLLRKRLKTALGENYLNPHGFRHSLATAMAEAGANAALIKTQLNHSNFKTSEKYIHLVRERLEPELNKVNPLAD